MLSPRLLFAAFVCAFFSDSAAVVHETQGPFGTAIRISTLAGRKGSSGFIDGKGTAASFNAPQGCVVSPDGETIFVADTGNNAIRQMQVNSGQVSMLVGSVPGGGFIDGRASNAQLSAPRDLVLGPGGQLLYIADYGNCAVRQLSLQSAIVSTKVGGQCIATESNGICQRGSQRVKVFLTVSEQNDGGYAGAVQISFAYPTEDGSLANLPYTLLVEGSEAGKSYAAEVEVPAIPTQISIRAMWQIGTNWHDNFGIKGIYVRLCGSSKRIVVLEDPTPGGTPSGCSDSCQYSCCYSTYWLTSHEGLDTRRVDLDSTSEVG